MKQNILLFGDIGGTNTRIGLGYFDEKNQLTILNQFQYLSADYIAFIDIINDFLQRYSYHASDISAACFAAAGPVKDGEVKFTNLKWTLSIASIRLFLHLDQIYLLNDFVSAGYGLQTLSDADLYSIQSVKPIHQSLQSIIGAGTGLGIAHIHFNHNKPMVHATEGGHIDFAPVGPTQIRLLQYLNKKLRRVSLERVLSGYGILNIYYFLHDELCNKQPKNTQLQQLLLSEPSQAGAHIAQFSDTDFVAAATLDLFMQIYAAAIGNLALTTLPYGGLYIAGGIAPKLIDRFSEDAFLNQLYAKGRVAGLIKSIPIFVVRNTDIGLRGAAYYVQQLSILNDTRNTVPV